MEVACQGRSGLRDAARKCQAGVRHERDLREHQGVHAQLAGEGVPEVLRALGWLLCPFLPLSRVVFYHFVIL